MKSKTCKNCKGGNVDGGCYKRIKRQMERLEQLKSEEINKLSRKTLKEKYIDETNKVHNHYNPLIKEKENETCKMASCGYCLGAGVREAKV